MRNLYDLICNVNNELIRGYVYSESEKNDIVNTFLGNPLQKVDDRNAMYPFFFRLNQDSKKQRLITGELPKTDILSANHYELEIMRILALWGRNRKDAVVMLDATAARLEKTCFGRFCSKGECTGATIAALRFYDAYCPDEDIAGSLLYKFRELHDGFGGWIEKADIPGFYMLLALSQMKSIVAIEEIQYCKERVFALLQKGCIVNQNNIDRYNPLRKYVLRNALARLEEYKYLKNAAIYTADDGRCYCKC